MPVGFYLFSLLAFIGCQDAKPGDTDPCWALNLWAKGGAKEYFERKKDNLVWYWPAEERLGLRPGSIWASQLERNRLVLTGAQPEIQQLAGGQNHDREAKAGHKSDEVMIEVRDMSEISTWASEPCRISMTVDKGSATQTWRKLTKCKNWAYTTCLSLLGFDPVTPRSKQATLRNWMLQDAGSHFWLHYRCISCDSVHLSHVYGTMKKNCVALICYWSLKFYH